MKNKIPYIIGIVSLAINLFITALFIRLLIINSVDFIAFPVFSIANFIAGGFFSIWSKTLARYFFGAGIGMGILFLIVVLYFIIWTK